MDYLNIDRQLLEQLAEITASVERINNAEMPHPLDKDLLLNQIKDLYATALKIEAKAEEHSVEESAEAFVQEGPQTFDPSKAEVAPQAEEPEAEPETPAANTDFESLQKPEESIPEPEPVVVEPEMPVAEQETPAAEPVAEPQQKPEENIIPEPEYDFVGENTDTELDDEALAMPEEEPEPAPEPEPVHEPTPEEKADVAERVMNRKNAIENLVSQQHTITSAPKAPEHAESTQTPASTEGQPQFSLFDYMPGASRVVENIAPAPQKPVVEPTPEPQPQATIVNPAPAPTPVAPQQPQTAPAAPAAPKYTDLRSIIGINDKFTFINDLFEKDMRNYNEFINTLNKIEDLDEARNFVQQNATLHNWDKESMAVQLFMSVYKRRYSTPLILL
jgi:chemotaxis protein histidine kinase CheA